MDEAEERRTSEIMRMKQAIMTMRESFILSVQELECSIDILLPSKKLPSGPITYDIKELRKMCNHIRPQQRKRIRKSR